MNSTITPQSGSSGSESGRRRRTRTLAIGGAVAALGVTAAIIVPGALSGSSGASRTQATPAVAAAASNATTLDGVRPAGESVGSAVGGSVGSSVGESVGSSVGGTQTLRVRPQISTYVAMRVSDGVYRIYVRGQKFVKNTPVQMAIFKDGGFPGVPSWTMKTTTRNDGTFDVGTDRKDCTRYGRPAPNATLMVQELGSSRVWSNKVRVSYGCGFFGER